MASQLQPTVSENWADRIFDSKGKLVMSELKKYAKATYGDPTTAAAFVATVKAEAELGTVESANYSRDAALKAADNSLTFTAADGKTKYTRKDLVKAVYDNPIYQAKDSKGKNNPNRLNEAGQKAFFDIYYDDAYRSEDYKVGNTSNEDGYKYRGRGLIQVTGKDNYKRLGDKLGVDLVANPELLDTDKNLMLKATSLYLNDKNFTNSGLTSNKLKRIIGHNNALEKGKTKTPAQERWADAQTHYKEMYGVDMPDSSQPIQVMSSPRPQMRPVPQIAATPSVDSASILSAVEEANATPPPIVNNPQESNDASFTQPPPQLQQPIIKEEPLMKMQYLADGTEEVIPPYILDAARPRVPSQLQMTPPVVQEFSAPTVVTEAPPPPVQTTPAEPMVRPSGGFGSNIEYDYAAYLRETGYNDVPAVREMFRRYMNKMNARSFTYGANTNPKLFGDNEVGFSGSPEQLAVPSIDYGYPVLSEPPMATNRNAPYPIAPMSTGGGFNPQTRSSYDSARMMEINNPLGEGMNSEPTVPAVQQQVTGPFSRVPRNYGNGLEAAQAQAIENGYVPEVINTPITDPRNLGGSEGYGSLGFAPQAQNPYDFNPYGNNPMGEIPVIENVDGYTNKELRVLANTDNASGTPWAEALQERTQREAAEIRTNLQTQADAGIVPTAEQLNQLSDMELQARNASEVAAVNREVVLANAQTKNTAEDALGATERLRREKAVERAAEQGITMGDVPAPTTPADPAMDNREKVPNDMDSVPAINNAKEIVPGSTSGTGLSLNKDGQIVGPNGNIIEMPGEVEAKSFGTTMAELGSKLGPIFKALFGLETQDMTRALGFYLMSRASGASHEGSMRWAGGTVLKQAEARGIRNSARADAAAKAFTAVSGNYTKQAAAKIRKELLAGNIVAAQALMDDAENKTARGKLGIDANATGTFYMIPGYTKAMEVFEGTGGNRYTKTTKTVDGKQVETYVPLSSEMMGQLRERNQDDDITSYLAAVRAHVNTMNEDLFKAEYTEDGEVVREKGIFEGRGKAGVTEDIMRISRQLGEKGMRNDPRELMTMVSKGAELAKAMGVTSINAETLFEMQFVGGDILFDQDKVSKDGELVPSSKIKSFTGNFQKILGNDSNIINATMNTAASNWNPEVTMDSIKSSTNYQGLSADEKQKIDSAPSDFMAFALLTAYANKT